MNEVKDDRDEDQYHVELKRFEEEKQRQMQDKLKQNLEDRRRQIKMKLDEFELRLKAAEKERMIITKCLLKDYSFF